MGGIFNLCNLWVRKIFKSGEKLKNLMLNNLRKWISKENFKFLKKIKPKKFKIQKKLKPEQKKTQTFTQIFLPQNIHFWFLKPIKLRNTCNASICERQHHECYFHNLKHQNLCEKYSRMLNSALLSLNFIVFKNRTLAEWWLMRKMPTLFPFSPFHAKTTSHMWIIFLIQNCVVVVVCFLRWILGFYEWAQSRHSNAKKTLEWDIWEALKTKTVASPIPITIINHNEEGKESVFGSHPFYEMQRKPER